MDLINQVVKDIRKWSGAVEVCRAQCTALVRRCEELAAKLNGKEGTLEKSIFEGAVVDLERALLKIRGEARNWGKYSHTKYFMWRDRMTDDLGAFNGLLDKHVRRFQTITDSEMEHQQILIELAQQDDQDERADMMYAIIRNAGDLERFAKDATQDGVRALMKAIQEELRREISDDDDRQVLQGGLDVLYFKTNILPPLIDLTGQITGTSEAPLLGEGATDIHEGRWVGPIKVMLKVTRCVGDREELSTSNLSREMSRWRQLEHGNILRFYGTCRIGPKTVVVSAWPDKGSLDVHIRDNPNCDRMRILSEVALGLKYLHMFKPEVVHGNLRAANVLISATGDAMLYGFGWRKVIPDEDGALLASSDIESTRWTSPELLQVDSDPSASLTTQSDVWSFGMLCLEVLTGQIPFYPRFRDDDEVTLAIREGTLPERPEPHDDLYKRGLSEEMWSLMVRCWARQPTARPEMRLLAMNVRERHMEHMRKYSVSSISESTRGTIQAICSSNAPVCGAAMSTPDLPTPPESTHMVSPPTSPLGSSRGGLPPPITINAREPRSTRSRTSDIGLHPEESDQHELNLSPTSTSGTNTRSTHRSSFPIELSTDSAPAIEYDELGSVLKGNLESLVKRLLVGTNATKMDLEFRECFLTMYRGFATTEHLWGLLVHEYRVLAPNQPIERQVRQNCVLILSDWLDIQYIQPQDRSFLLEMREFIRDNQWHVSVPEATRSSLAIKLDDHLAILDSSPAQPINRGPNESFNLDPQNPSTAKAIAEQIMKIQSDLFQKVLASECASWVMNIPVQGLPNIRRFNQSNDQIRGWCLSKILGQNESEQRARMVIFFIQAMDHCLMKRAFSSADAIFSALNHPYIQNLPMTWKYVGNSRKKSVERMTHMLNSSPPTSNGAYRLPLLRRRSTRHTKLSKDYMSMLNSNPETPCIPLLQKHLEEISERRERVVVNGDTINFQHVTEIYGKVKELVAYQVPQLRVACEPMSGTSRYIKQEFARIAANENLGAELQARSEKIVKLEEKDDRCRQTGRDAAGF